MHLKNKKNENEIIGKVRAINSIIDNLSETLKTQLIEALIEHNEKHGLFGYESKMELLKFIKSDKFIINNFITNENDPVRVYLNGKKIVLSNDFQIIGFDIRKIIEYKESRNKTLLMVLENKGTVIFLINNFLYTITKNLRGYEIGIFELSYLQTECEEYIIH